MNKKNNDAGMALVVVMMFLVITLALLAIYFKLTNSEISHVSHTTKSTTGFYSAEAGLNTRAEEIRNIFVGYNQPSGTSPNENSPCSRGNKGSGDYVCKDFKINNRTVSTYVIEDPDNPKSTTIPAGERYQNLSTQEYSYTTYAVAKDKKGHTEALLSLRFKSRLVPLFQFAAFYNKDLEILPGANMQLSGPVYTNGDLYLDSDGAVLTIEGQTMTAGELYRGRKDNRSTRCHGNSVKIHDSQDAARTLISNCSSLVNVSDNDIKPWNGLIQQNIQKVTVPDPRILDATPNSSYFTSADLRLKLVLNQSTNSVSIQVRNPDDSQNLTATSLLTNIKKCPGNRNKGVVKMSEFWNLREGGKNQLLDIDMRGLLTCLKSTNWFNTGKQLSDTTDGGLVFHFSVEGPRSNYPSSLYGIRLGNAESLQPTSGTQVQGLTVVSDQAIYTWGNYNSSGKIPAAIMADTIHVLSSNWNDSNCGTSASSCGSLNNRKATNTTVNAAFLTSTNTTGDIEGPGGQNGSYSGGYENSIRFQEAWSGYTFTYKGSIVSLNTPRHANGKWRMDEVYSVPNRNWTYDTSFNNANNLPPMTPRFVYLKQELFERDFEQ